MKLSIIIPCEQAILQNQSLEPLFISLNNQVKADWEDVEIILIHPYLQYKFDFNKFPEIKDTIKTYYVNKQNYGSLKQFGLDVAQGDYVMFLTPNLILYCMTSIVDLKQRLNALGNKDYYLFNVINGMYFTENNQFGVNNSLMNLEGKVFNKNFLQLNNIHFLENCLTGEDIYFMQAVHNCNPQYSIESDPLCIQLFPTMVYEQEQTFLNNLSALMIANTENITKVLDTNIDKIVEVLFNTYATIVSYSNIEFQVYVKKQLITFITNLQNYFNIDLLFKKIELVSQNNEIPNQPVSFSDFILSLFVTQNETYPIENVEEEEVEE